MRPVSRKDLDDAEQEASGEYRTPAGDLTVTSPWGLGHKHLAPIACELTAWTGVLSVLARFLGRRLTGLVLAGADPPLYCFVKPAMGRCRSVRAQPRPSSRRLWQQPPGEFSHFGAGAPRDFARGAAQRDKAVRVVALFSIALDI